MSGHVGIIANDAGRYTIFSVALTQLKHPVNTGILWKLTSDRIIGRNAVVRDALDVGSEWVMFLDDDHTFPADILNQLLSHNLPVVGALYVQRAAPFMPIAYSSKNEEDGMYTPLRLTDDLPEKGLVQVRACGTGGMLIRSEVFHQLEYPWFEHGEASEDLIFCDKVHELGIPIHVDTGIRMGHLSMAACWPDHSTGKWAIGFSLADGFEMIAAIDHTAIEEGAVGEPGTDATTDGSDAETSAQVGPGSPTAPMM